MTRNRKGRKGAGETGSFGMPKPSKPSLFAISPPPPNNTQLLASHAQTAKVSPDNVEEKSTALSAIFRNEKSHPSHLNTHRGYEAPTAASHDLVMRRMGNGFQILKVMETIKVGYPFNNKTFGCIKEKGGPILMTSYSGWVTKAPEHPKVLDNARWAKFAYDFCQLLEHPLSKGHMYEFRAPEPGYYQASHVEKRLILWFLCSKLSEKDGKLNESKLKAMQNWRLAGRPVVAVLTLDKDACNCCINFKKRIEEVTGLVIEIECAPTLAQIIQGREGSSRVNQLVPGGDLPILDVIASQVTGGGKDKTSPRKARSRGLKTSAPIVLPKTTTLQIIISSRYEDLVAATQATQDEPRRQMVQKKLPTYRVKKRAVGNGSPSVAKRASRHNGLSPKLTDDVFGFKALEALDLRRRPRKVDAISMGKSDASRPKKIVYPTPPVMSRRPQAHKPSKSRKVRSKSSKNKLEDFRLLVGSFSAKLQLD